MASFNSLRCEVSSLDLQLIRLLSKRKKVVKNIAQIKKKNKLQVVDKSREKEIFSKYNSYAKSKSVDQKLVKKLFKLITSDSKSYQKRLISK